MSSQPTSFLWYDLETWGTDPRGARIAQFAAQRTDAALNPIEEPVTLWVKPALDFLPSPGAAGVTGLTPQQLDARGITEAEAFAQIQAMMAEPGTCCVGWNSLRFDDEFIRFGLYRNFFDPYEREWSSGNSRWDLLDFARLCHALRPDGIVWPKREDGPTSFRLEHLAAANGVEHGAAHDAQSDVQATLGMARRFRDAHPRLWDYHLAYRDKRKVAALLQPGGEPLLHVSSRFPAERACAGIVLPVATHPSAGNQVLVVELSADVDDWLSATPEQLAERMFTRADQLPEGVTRVPVKAVHLNRCPALVALSHVRPAEWERLGLDPDAARRRAAQIRQVQDLGDRLRDAFRRDFDASTDVDGALYDLLPAREDAALRRRIQRASPAELAALSPIFRDPRGETLLWRYRARNWPESLSADERAQWRQDIAERLREPPRGALGWDTFSCELAALRDSGRNGLADALGEWAERVYAAAGLPLPSSMSAIQ